MFKVLYSSIMEVFKEYLTLKQFQRFVAEKLSGRLKKV